MDNLRPLAWMIRTVGLNERVRDAVAVPLRLKRVMVFNFLICRSLLPSPRKKARWTESTKLRVSMFIRRCSRS